MKKFLCFALCFVLLISLVGCSGYDADVRRVDFKFDEPHYNYGIKALDIADKLIDFEISVNDAYNQIDDLMSSESLLPETEFGDEYHFGNSSIESNVLYLHSEILYVKIGYSDLSGLKEKRDNLASSLGKQ